MICYSLCQTLLIVRSVHCQIIRAIKHFIQYTSVKFPEFNPVDACGGFPMELTPQLRLALLYRQNFLRVYIPTDIVCTFTPLKAPDKFSTPFAQLFGQNLYNNRTGTLCFPKCFECVG